MRWRALPPETFAMTKQQIRQPLIDRMAKDGARVDAIAERIWTSPDTLAHVRADVETSRDRPFEPKGAEPVRQDLSIVAGPISLRYFCTPGWMSPGFGAAILVFCGVVSRPCASRFTSAGWPWCSALASR